MGELYANVEQGHYGNCGDETIYENGTCHVVKSTTGFAASGLEGSKVDKKCSFRAAALILGLLCLLLLAGLVALVLLHTEANFTWETERLQLQTRLAEEQNQTQKTLALQSQDKWIYFRNSFYYISSVKKPWNESRQDCRQRDADLVIINNEEEQEFVRRWKTRSWIGLTDAEKEGTWKWVDGTPLGTLRYWAESEPNDAKGIEDCVEIHHYDQQKSWNDAPCEIEKDWICERGAK